MKRTLSNPRGTGSSQSAGSPDLDGFFLERAVDLAWRGSGKTPPNPMVGAVVVKDGAVVGEGWHAAYGLAHAETVALDEAGERARGGVLYVTLEPCTHEGNTPPCIGRILQSGVRRVVVCTLDPDHRMDGRGVAALRDGGVEVEVGRRAERAVLLNMPYFKRKMGLGSAVTLKIATSLDGRITSRRGERTDISGAAARRYVHRLRSSHDGILVGINTLLIDDPKLDCRLLDDPPSPVPIVLDTNLRFPQGRVWATEGRKYIVASSKGCDAAAGREIERQGGVVLRCATRDGRVDIASAIELLAREDILSVLVEGGAEVLTSFLESSLWDSLYWFVSPSIFGRQGVEAVSDRVSLDDAVLAEVTGIAPDVMIGFINEATRTVMLDRLTEGW